MRPGFDAGQEPEGVPRKPHEGEYVETTTRAGGVAIWNPSRGGGYLGSTQGVVTGPHGALPPCYRITPAPCEVILPLS